MDYDCNWQDLDYIQGSGRPLSNADVCCATFPREMWDDSIKNYRFQATKHCYSLPILENRTDFNYYKQAYCDSAIFGIAELGMATVAAIIASMVF